jgi:hypothetical protein
MGHLNSPPGGTAESAGFRLFVWDATDRGQEVSGVAHAKGDAQRALVAALAEMDPGARGMLRPASLDIAASRKNYDYGEPLLTGVRLPHGVRIIPASR